MSPKKVESVESKVEEVQEEEVYVPRVSVSSRGKVSETLESVAEAFRKANSGMDCRWVFHSARKPELSNILSRTAEGYQLVKSSEFKGTTVPLENFEDADGHIRIADVILMKIPTGQRKVNLLARQRLADDQVRRVKEGFQSAMERVKAGDHRSASRGAVKLQEKEHDLTYDQPNKE